MEKTNWGKISSYKANQYTSVNSLPNLHNITVSGYAFEKSLLWQKYKIVIAKIKTTIKLKAYAMIIVMS